MLFSVYFNKQEMHLGIQLYSILGKLPHNVASLLLAPMASAICNQLQRQKSHRLNTFLIFRVKNLASDLH